MTITGGSTSKIQKLEVFDLTQFEAVTLMRLVVFAGFFI